MNKKELLKTLRYDTYQQYLSGNHWKHFKKMVFRRKKYKEKMKELGSRYCEYCFVATNNVHVHHKTYARLGKEFLGDVDVLCECCHTQVHELYRLGKMTLTECSKHVKTAKKNPNPIVEKTKPIEIGKKAFLGNKIAKPIVPHLIKYKKVI